MIFLSLPTAVRPAIVFNTAGYTRACGERIRREGVGKRASQAVLTAPAPHLFVRRCPLPVPLRK